MLKKIIAVVVGIIGFVMIIFVTLPIASYVSKSKIEFPNLTSPIEKLQNENEGQEVDYTKASNWFEGDNEKDIFSNSKVSFYTISIPELKIESATVAIGGEDLSNHLIHYPGTSLPGKKGNSVIFGHSILPIFFNPENYLSIFSTLPTLEKGSEVVVEYDGVTYKYLVEDKFEVQPTDIQILEQNTNNSYLTLVTCTPPGDPRKLKRLIVRAKLAPLE